MKNNIPIGRIGPLTVEISHAHAHRADHLLEILHDIQQRLGYIPGESLGILAELLNRTKAEILGVISFYPDFKQTPPKKHCLKICQAEACQSMQSRNLVAFTESHIAHHDVSEQLTVEPVYCLGFCAIAPAIMLNGQGYGRVSVERLRVLLQELVL